VPRTHLLIALAAATLGSLPLRGAQSTAAGPAPFELPAPTGTYPVGTTTWRLTDSARRETLDGSGAPRSVEVFAWYPAAPAGGRRAPYLREGLAEVRTFAKMIGAAEGVWDGLANVQTHAVLDAMPALSLQKFPVLVFSHGYTGVPSAYTALLEDMASHGYAVLSIVHPYEATAATLADGRVVSLLDGSGKPVAGVGEVFAEWRTEDATAEAVTKTSDEAEKARMWAAAGNMWIAANQPGKAAIALDKALVGTGLQAEQRGEALLDRARAAEAQNDLKTARSRVNEAARTIFEDPFLWYFSAALAIREGDAMTAKTAIGKALTLEPNNPTILFEAGHVHHFTGDEAAARSYWSRAASADPNGKAGQAAREALAMLSKPANVQSEAAPTK